MAKKQLSPHTFLNDCCEMDPAGRIELLDVADALAGYRLHHGKRAAPVTLRTVRRELAFCDIGVSEHDGGMTLFRIRLSPTGEAMVNAWLSAPEQLRCGTCGEVRMPMEGFALCWTCDTFTASSGEYCDIPTDLTPVDWWVQADLKRAIEAGA